MAVKVGPFVIENEIAVARWEQLLLDTQADSDAEVFQNAIRLYEHLIARTKNNKPLYEKTASGEFVEVNLWQ